MVSLAAAVISTSVEKTQVDSDLGCACFQEKYYRVSIARAAVNESVCEDSHAEHAQLQLQQFPCAPFRTYVAEVIL